MQPYRDETNGLFIRLQQLERTVIELRRINRRLRTMRRETAPWFLLRGVVALVGGTFWLAAVLGVVLVFVVLLLGQVWGGVPHV